MNYIYDTFNFLENTALFSHSVSESEIGSSDVDYHSKAVNKVMKNVNRALAESTFA